MKEQFNVYNKLKKGIKSGVFGAFMIFIQNVVEFVCHYA